MLEVLDCQEALPMLWRASLNDDANKRQRLIAEAERCHARKVRFPNTLDEVQMLQTLSDSALPTICSVASGTANVAMKRR